MSETRKLAAILVADVVGYSRLAGADEDRTLARLRGLRSDLIDPAIAAHHGRIVKRTGDGGIIEFRSAVDAVRCAIEVQSGLIERNAGVPEDRRIEFRVGIHVGDVVEESDGDLMGDGVNIAARLEGFAKPGGIGLSEDAYRQVKARLDLKVSDLGPTQLKNIAEPIKVYSLDVGQPASAAPAPTAREASRPPRLSIVVLPFTNLGGDPEQEYFADGVTEGLTTDLSRIRGTFVIARNTAFTFKGKSVEVKKLGRDLNVRYVLEGSIQRSSGRIRVNVQLIDAETEHHLWAERFDKPVVDLFDMQDEIVARLANTLNAELTAVEAGRAERTPNPNSMDFYFQGRAWFDKGRTPEIIKKAREFFEKALDVDANNSQALAGLASCYAIDFQIGWRATGVDYEFEVFGPADRALALDRENTLAYLAKGWYFIGCSRHPEARRIADAGLAVNPNSAPLFALRSLANSYLSQFEQAKSDVLTAMRLSPRDPSLSQWRNFLADAELGLGHLEASIEESSKAIDGGYRVSYSYLNLAAARGIKGDVEEAKKALVEARRLNPELSVKWINDRKPILQPAVDSLRKAGLPEQ